MSVPSKSSHTIEFNENNNNQATKKEDHEVTRKYCCWSPSCFTIWNVKQSVTEGGNEKMIELNVVVESLRWKTCVFSALISCKSWVKLTRVSDLAKTWAICETPILEWHHWQKHQVCQLANVYLGITLNCSAFSLSWCSNDYCVSLTRLTIWVPQCWYPPPPHKILEWIFP